jgi:hypothetical protein
MPTPARSPFRLVWRILGGLVVLGGGGGYLCRHRLHRWFTGEGPRPGSVWGEQDDLDFQPRIQEEGLTPEAAPNFGRLLDTFRIKLTAQQKAFLAANHFVLLPRESTTLAGTANRDELLDAFDRVGGDANILNRSPENAKLVTPDLVLHAFSRFFGMTLEQLERGELRRDLRHFLEGILEVAAEAEKGAPAAAAPGYQRIRAQMAVALVLLESCGPLPPPFFESPEAERSYAELDDTLDSYDNAADRLLQLLPDLPEEGFNRALKELSLIYEAEGAEPSPLFGQYDPETRTDYTQFTPRSYYARCSALRAYFRAMIYLGRSGYALKSDAGLTDAVLLAGLFSRKDAAGKPPAVAWQRMMDITTLYAGASDDLTCTEWRAFLKDAAGSEAPDVTPELLARLRQGEGRLRQPRILPDLARDRRTARTDPDLRLASRVFRIFGQRFSYDAWILNRLNAKSNLPATALYLPACLGDRRALAHATEFVRRQGPAPMSDAAVAAALEDLGKGLAREPAAQWEASLGAGWLAVLGTLTHAYGAGYPRYMQSQPFGDKQIQTFLGSYTELKHNTLLYSKQSYDEMGEGGDGPIPPVVKGFVEPNLAFWNAFSGLVQRTRARFEGDGLFPPGVVLERLKEFVRDTEFYRKFAIRELKGEPISDEDYETLRVRGLSYMAEPLSGADQVTEETGKVAVVVDVLTDGWAGTVLCEGTGRPYLMLALVGNEKSPRLTVGLAFNHYEFTEPLGTRTTDEGWKPRVYAGSPRPPAKNFWYQSLGVR